MFEDMMLMVQKRVNEMKVENIEEALNTLKESLRYGDMFESVEGEEAKETFEQEGVCFICDATLKEVNEDGYKSLNMEYYEVFEDLEAIEDSHKNNAMCESCLDDMDKFSEDVIHYLESVLAKRK